MATLTTAAALAIAVKCVGPALAPIAVGVALHENPRLDIEVVNHNRNGTDDHGLAQINDVNFGWLSQALHQPINAQTILDPCTNFKASMAVLFAKYNGNPPDAIKATYAEGAMRRVQLVADGGGDVPPATPPAPSCPTPDPTGWHTIAIPRGCPQPQETHDESPEKHDEKP